MPPPLAEDPLEIGEPEMKVAIVGRRNVGKSTFVNTLVQAERMIVSEVPGTTRDSVDVRFELDGKSFVAIDTPGIRRTKSVKTDIDFYGTHRAQRSIRRADVVLLVLRRHASGSARSTSSFATTSPSNTGRASSSSTSGTSSSNRCPPRSGSATCTTRFRTMRYVPIAFITGQTGKNVKALLNHAQMLFKQSRARVPAPASSTACSATRCKRSPPPAAGQSHAEDLLRDASRRAAADDRALLQRPDALSRTYQRYLLGKFRDELDFPEVPIKLYLRRRHPADLRDEVDSQLATGEKESGRSKKSGSRKKAPADA